MKRNKAQTGVVLTRSAMRRMPLPELHSDSDKEDRGRVLVVGGSAQVPGAVLLAGVAALRVGAGKLQLATVASVSGALGVAVPEAMVIGMPAASNGELSAALPTHLLREAERADAVLIGPGIASDRAAASLMKRLIPRLRDGASVVLDAGALPTVAGATTLLASLDGRVVLTPHCGEMAAMLGIEKKDVDADLPRIAGLAAKRFGAVVVLKSDETWIADPKGTSMCFRGGVVGLATSGSGDVLAGMIAGLLARGATPLTAAAWGVWSHGMAGKALSQQGVQVGFLARDLVGLGPSAPKTSPQLTT